MTPHDMFAPLKDTDADARPVAAAPLIERGRRQRRVRRAAAAGGVAVSVFVAGGVGYAAWPRPSTGTAALPGAEGVGLVQKVGAAVLEAGSAQLDLRVHLVVPQTGANADAGATATTIPKDIHATGGLDFTRRSSVLNVSGDVQNRALAVQILVTPDKSYVSNPMKPGTWIALPSGSQLAGVNANSPALDPQRVLDQLPADAGNTVFVGNDTVRGVATSHYRGSIPLGSHDPSSTASGAPSTKASPSTEAATPVSQPFDLWLDAKGLPRRVVITAAPSAVDPQQPSGTVTLDLFGYGEQVTMKLPSAGSITSLDEAKGSLSELFGGSKPGTGSTGTTAGS